MKTPLFSSEQVDALQAVDLQLGWVTHGYDAEVVIENFPSTYGPVICGVSDSDYAVAKNLTSNLTRNDLIVRERSPGSANPNQTPLVVGVVSTINAALRRSPYVDRSPLDEPSDLLETLHRDNQDTDPTSLRSYPGTTEALLASLAIARKLWLVDIFDYVDGLRVAQDIPSAIADTPDIRLLDVPLEKRNIDMAQCLGNHAIRLIRRTAMGNDKPKLGFIAGRGHKGVEDIITSHGISVQSQTAKHARTVGQRVRANIPFLSTSLEQRQMRDVARWLENLKK